MTRIEAEFFTRHPVDCARDLIGCVLEWDGCAGRIVETEAYASLDDPACHTYFRPSSRVFVESHAAGAAYIYLNYGVHWLFNVLVKSPVADGFVLIRALEPLRGLEAMRERRPGHADAALGAGPGKWTRAFGIDGASHGVEFLHGYQRGIYRGHAVEILTGPRIGISNGRELPWRFGLADSRSLSRKF